MFREAERIERTIALLSASALNRSDTEFLFVDDGSDDGTAAVTSRALEASGLVGRVIRSATNQGKGAAVRAGVLEATGATVVFVDADLSAGVEDIDRCLRTVEKGGADLVLGTRLRPGSLITRQPPVGRILAGKVFNLLLRRLGMTAFPDTQCGLKAFSGPAAQVLFRDLRIQGFAFDVELLAMAAHHGLSVVEVPITWGHVPASRVHPIRDGAHMAVDVVKLWHSLRRLRAAPAAAPFDGAEGGGIAAPAYRELSDTRFDAMARVEGDHWWWRAKRELVAAEIRRDGGGSGPALDVGCGTGEMPAMLAGLGFTPAIGTDVSIHALSLARGRPDPVIGLLVATAEALPIAGRSARCLTSLDVVEHLDDDVLALREYARVVKPGGLVIVGVPAYTWAWSDHDVALGHRRRYTRRSLVAAARTAGLEVHRCTYYHSWLVLPAFALRRTPLRRLLRTSPEEASYVGPRANRWLTRVTDVERRVADRMGIPFGLSVLLVARVPQAHPNGASAHAHAHAHVHAHANG